MTEPMKRPTIADLKAMVPAGELICEIRQPGTLVLKRPDLSVGSVPGALYIIDNGNAALNLRKYASARVESSAPDAYGATYSQGAYRPLSVGGWLLDEDGDEL